MTTSRKTTLAAFGALLVATPAQAAPTVGAQARSNGPNTPRSEEVVPSDIRPQDPAVAGGMRGLDASGARSRWHDIQLPPARPPGL